MRAIGAGTRVFEVLDRKSLIPLHEGIELSPDRRGTIRFEHVHFEYPTRKDVKILKDFNLQINVGETVAIVCVVGGLPLHFCLIVCPAGRVVVESHRFILCCSDITIPATGKLSLMARVRKFDQFSNPLFTTST